jgi:hypothetical protein
MDLSIDFTGIRYGRFPLISVSVSLSLSKLNKLQSMSLIILCTALWPIHPSKGLQEITKDLWNIEFSLSDEYDSNGGRSVVLLLHACTWRKFLKFAVKMGAVIDYME